MDKDLQPRKVSKVLCPVCGELMIKFYPWSSYLLNPNQNIVMCRKCTQKERNKLRAK